MMKVADIEELSKIAKNIGAITVVDNTFLTPHFQKTTRFGSGYCSSQWNVNILVVIHDTIAGIVIVKDEEMAKHFRLQLKSHGNGLASFDSWLIIRGLKNTFFKNGKT